MKKLVIIGARHDGHAKVVYEICKALPGIQVAGFLDDNPDLYGKSIQDKPILGPVGMLEDLVSAKDADVFFIALGNNRLRRELGRQLLSICPSINLIHPSAVLDPTVKLGTGNVIMQNAVVVGDSQIGDFVNIHALSSIDHDNVLESGSNIAPGSHLAGRVQVGVDAFLGTGTSVIPDIQIGKGVIVGAGSVVIRNLPNFVKAVGNPARIIENIQAY